MKFVGENQDDWDNHLDATLFGYRTSKHRSTGYSPFLMLYHREAHLPVGPDPMVRCSEDQMKNTDVKDTDRSTDAYIEDMHGIS